MKNNWKRLAALLLAVILMLSLTGIGEDEIVSDDVSAKGIISEADVDVDATISELDTTIDMLDIIDPQQDIVKIGEETPPQPAQDSSEINADSTVTLGVNETSKLSTKGLGKNLTFQSSKPKIACVTNKGVVKGLKKGTAQISILSGSKVKAKYTVKVVAAPKNVTLPATTITLGVKESLTMTPATPKNTHTTFTWTSKNKKIAAVSKAGKITGKKAGNTTVTVQTHNGKTATLKVVVKAAPKKVTLNKTSLKMELYDEFQLKATLTKGSVSNRLTWTSSDEDIVTVFDDGWLFANAPGSATITVKTYNGKKATCKVTVVGDEEEEEEDTPTPEPTAEPTPEPTAEPTPESSIAIDDNNFPDDIFRNYIQDEYDLNEDGLLSQNERDAVTKITVHKLGIADMTGIKLFPNLSSLTCWGNPFTSLDVSNCTALTYISCGGYSEYEVAPLSSLNISGCTALNYLSCGCSKLKELNLERCYSLNNILCSHSQLETLNVSNLSELTRLTCSDNKLKTLYLRGCSLLNSLDCSLNQLAELDVSVIPAIQYLTCNNNRFIYLDVSNSANLYELNCKSCPITVLKVENCPNLKRLNCSECELRSLYPAGCYKLSEVYCFSNMLMEVDFSYCASLQRLNCSENQLTELYVGNSPDLALLCCERNNITKVDLSNCDKLAKVAKATPEVKDLVAYWPSAANLTLSIDTFTTLIADGEVIY